MIDAVVVVLGREARGELVGAVDRRPRRRRVESSAGRHVVGEAAVRPAVAVVRLLAEEAEARPAEHDVVALGVRGPEAVDARAPAASRRATISSSTAERVVVELARRRAARGSPGTCPSGPRRGRRTASRLRHELRELGLDDPRARERRRGQVVEVDAVAVRPRLRRAGSSGRRSFSACCSRRRSWSSRFSTSSAGAPRRVEQARDDVDDPARVEHVHRLVRVGRARSSPPCAGARSSRRRSGAAARSPRRSISARDVDHLVERRRDQAREADDVGALLDRRCRGSARRAPSRRGRSTS